MSPLSLISAVIAFLFLYPLPSNFPQAAEAPKSVLKDGTPVKLRLSHNLSSADARTGDQVDFEVLEEVKVGDMVVIPKGGVAWGTVTEAQPKKLLGGSGKLNVSVDHVQLTSGEKAALRPVKQTQRSGQTGAVAAGSSGQLDSLVRMVYGKDVAIPKGTELTAYVNGDFAISTSKFQPAAPRPSVAPEGGVPAAESQTAGVSVLVSSVPASADIELDGAFVGSTPSIISMPAGDHTIVIRKKSFKPWERKIKAMLGSIKIEAELEPMK